MLLEERERERERVAIIVPFVLPPPAYNPAPVYNPPPAPYIPQINYRIAGSLDWMDNPGT
jgi:hypothetical protein